MANLNGEIDRILVSNPSSKRFSTHNKSLSKSPLTVRRSPRLKAKYKQLGKRLFVDLEESSDDVVASQGSICGNIKCKGKAIAVDNGIEDDGYWVQAYTQASVIEEAVLLSQFENVQLTNENPDECHPINEPSTTIADNDDEKDVDLVYKEYQECAECGEVGESLTVAGLNNGVTSHATGQSSGVTSHASGKKSDELVEFSFRDFMKKITQEDAYKANDKEEEGSDRDDVNDGYDTLLVS